MANTFEGIGLEAIKKLFESLEFNVTEYCNAAIDSAYEYCIQEFKKSCNENGIQWDKRWEAILYDE